MNLKNTLLTAAFGLITSALSAQSANIQISALPFNIVAPGTYLLTGNLSYPGILPVSGALPPPYNGSTAITVNTAASGPVVIDLNGYTLSEGTYPSAGIFIEISSNASSTTIRNGTLQGFWIGLGVGLVGNTPSPNHLSNIHIANITFSDRYADVSLNQVNASSISYCSFVVQSGSDTIYGIRDDASQGGNSYIKNSFDGGQQTELAVSSGPLVLERCQFTGPVK